MLKLNLPTLKFRRLLADLMLVLRLKILNGKLTVDNNIFEFAHFASLRGLNSKLIQQINEATIIMLFISFHSSLFYSFCYCLRFVLFLYFIFLT